MRQMLEAIAVTAELIGKEISPAAAAVMARDLGEYPQEIVLQALTNLRRASGARFSLDSVIAQIERLQPDGRPGADEAWAMIPKDEDSSAVMTEEMAEAYGIALPLMNDGDKIGARMAFRDAYTRIVERNKIAGIPPKWFPSLGRDVEGREVVLTEAVRLGRLTQQHAAGLLPHKGDVGILPALMGNAPLRLATVNGDPVEDAEIAADVKARIAECKAILGGKA